MKNKQFADENKKLNEMCGIYCMEIEQIKADLANMQALMKKQKDEIDKLRAEKKE